MPSLLRVIRKDNWYTNREVPEWLPEGDLPGDVLSDFQTTHCGLSVWLVDDDRGNLEAILAAFACTRKSIDKIDYLLIDADVVNTLGLALEQCPGVTPDDQVNQHWHRDLKRLSAARILEIASIFFPERCTQCQRVPPQKVQELVANAIDSGRLERNRIADGIIKQIEDARERIAQKARSRQKQEEDRMR